LNAAAAPALSLPSTESLTAAADSSCKHSDKNAQGKPWLTSREIGAKIDALNVSPPEIIYSRLSSLDATLFKDNKTGWDACQTNVAKWATDFVWSYMNTGSAKKRGFWAECRHCDAVLHVMWHPDDKETTLEPLRRNLLNFFCVWPNYAKEPLPRI
jgi:hypothetical protein